MALIRMLQVTCLRVQPTHKKRFPVAGTDLSAIKNAIQSCIDDGRFSAENASKIEVDWGFSDVTLSISYDSEVAYPFDTELSKVSRDEIIRFAQEAMPEKEADWKSPRWGTDLLQQSALVGPITYSSLEKGSWKANNDVTIKKIKLQIWPLTDITTGHISCIAELSFKFKVKDTADPSDEYAAAANARNLLMGFLDEKGILLRRDSLKTTAILDAYLPSSVLPEPDPGSSDPDKDDVSPENSSKGSPLPGPAESAPGKNDNSSGYSSEGSPTAAPSGSGPSGRDASYSGAARAAGRGRSRGYYTITGRNTAAYISCGVSRKAAAASVPDRIKIGNRMYRVTRIAPGAFTGFDNLRRVIIGENVSFISEGAFAGCVRLKALKLCSPRLTRRKIRNCLRGSRIRTIRLSRKAKKKYPVYRKIFTKKITGSSVKPVVQE